LITNQLDVSFRRFKTRYYSNFTSKDKYTIYFLECVRVVESWHAWARGGYGESFTRLVISELALYYNTRIQGNSLLRAMPEFQGCCCEAKAGNPLLIGAGILGPQSPYNEMSALSG
jgi:hypothetical protein